MTNYNVENFFPLLSESHMIIIDCENGAIIDVNESALNFYGYTYNEFISLFIEDINPYIHDDMLFNNGYCVNGLEGNIFEHLTKDGQKKIIRLFSQIINLSNNKNIVLYIIKDITDISTKNMNFESQSSFIFLFE